MVVYQHLVLLVAGICFFMFGMIVASDNLQILAADLFAGRDPGLRDLLRRAKPLWTRMFILGLIVYGFSDLLRFSFRRAWAISAVCFDDSIRQKVLWITPLAMIGVIPRPRSHSTA